MQVTSEIFKCPPGTKDILPDEGLLWQYVENKAKDILTLYGYMPIRTPILENSSLFNRSLGQETEIVKKQMFLIEREKETFCLRPEATAAVVRAYLENSLDKTNPFVKLYYIGPMFRAERPQKGRLRQFHHIGIEAIGSLSAYLDVEVIVLARRILESLNISGYSLKINSIGCPSDKEGLSKLLRQKLKESLNRLCADCNERFERNVFRILDCKNTECKQVVSQINLQYNDYLCNDCVRHFTIVTGTLDALKIPYAQDITLVRGLDYYNRTVFEISHPDLGAQDALGAGGRYDNLIADLGGHQAGAIGFAFGIERLLLVAQIQSHLPAWKLEVVIISLGEVAQKEGFLLLSKLRDQGIACDTDYEGRSLKAQMRKANDARASLVALLGENELKKRVITVKDMRTGNQEEINSDNFIEEIKKRL